MGIRNWLRKAQRGENGDDEVKQEQRQEAHDTATFQKMQVARLSEAQALFDEEEIIEVVSIGVEAPYDASSAQADALLFEADGEAFTHLDEVVIEDVAEVDDPLASARVEGDVPQPVEFEHPKNSH